MQENKYIMKCDGLGRIFTTKILDFLIYLKMCITGNVSGAFKTTLYMNYMLKKVQM